MLRILSCPVCVSVIAINDLFISHDQRLTSGRLPAQAD